MALLRPLAHLLLVLALLANLGFGSASSGMAHASHGADQMSAADASGGCHHPAPEAAPKPAQDNCCDGGDCTCSCLHHAPVVMITVASFPMAVHGRVPQLGRLTSVPTAWSAPEMRPPIV